MQTVTDISIFDKGIIAEDQLWNLGDEKDLLLHRIHAYPAKFPPFLVKKLINYFERQGKSTELIADVFCGCGTSALESVRSGKGFWGCDINPVATLIAKTKSRAYQTRYLNAYHQEISERVVRLRIGATRAYHANPRLNYWFKSQTIDELFRIRQSIERIVPEGKYREFFLTGFSNILKPCSRWLTKSIKPQVDPNKKAAIPSVAFEKQIKMMVKAVQEVEGAIDFHSNVNIVNRNLLNLNIEGGFADVVITSPPYVTSYEYADLHQLSALWLDYVDDYRNLRNGSIGSEHHSSEVAELYEKANQIAQTTYDALEKADDSKAKSVLRYFYDLDCAVGKIKSLLKAGGSAAFVIGNTSYKGVHIDNAKTLAQSLLNHHFRNVRVSKRKISYKILTPYRNSKGRFTSHSRGRKVYSHEYILIAEN